MVVCVEKLSGNSVLDSISVSLFCTHAVMAEWVFPCFFVLGCQQY
jgi:hypothetical protein